MTPASPVKNEKVEEVGETFGLEGHHLLLGRYHVGHFCKKNRKRKHVNERSAFKPLAVLGSQ